jgi:hypothetical protein
MLLLTCSLLAVAVIGMAGRTLAERAAQAALDVEEADSWTEAQWEVASEDQRIAALKVLKRKWPGWRNVSWEKHDEAWIDAGWLHGWFNRLIVMVRAGDQDDQPPLRRVTASPLSLSTAPTASTVNVNVNVNKRPVFRPDRCASLGGCGERGCLQTGHCR